MMTKTTVAGAVAAHKGRAERRDNFVHLKNIHIPTLVIAGEKDYFFSVATVEQVAHEIPNAQFEIINGSGHLPNMCWLLKMTICNFHQRPLGWLQKKCYKEDKRCFYTLK